MSYLSKNQAPPFDRNHSGVVVDIPNYKKKRALSHAIPDALKNHKPNKNGQQVIHGLIYLDESSDLTPKSILSKERNHARKKNVSSTSESSPQSESVKSRSRSKQRSQSRSRNSPSQSLARQKSGSVSLVAHPKSAIPSVESPPQLKDKITERRNQISENQRYEFNRIDDIWLGFKGKKKDLNLSSSMVLPSKPKQAPKKFSAHSVKNSPEISRPSRLKIPDFEEGKVMTEVPGKNNKEEKRVHFSAKEEHDQPTQPQRLYDSHVKRDDKPSVPIKNEHKLRNHSVRESIHKYDSNKLLRSKSGIDAEIPKNIQTFLQRSRRSRDDWYASEPTRDLPMTPSRALSIDRRVSPPSPDYEELVKFSKMSKISSPRTANPEKSFIRCRSNSLPSSPTHQNIFCSSIIPDLSESVVESSPIKQLPEFNWKAKP